jgi:hypothetical protein
MSGICSSMVKIMIDTCGDQAPYEQTLATALLCETARSVALVSAFLPLRTLESLRAAGIGEQFEGMLLIVQRGPA